VGFHAVRIIKPDFPEFSSDITMFSNKNRRLFPLNIVHIDLKQIIKEVRLG
jgi:hypothetical protein